MFKTDITKTIRNRVIDVLSVETAISGQVSQGEEYVDSLIEKFGELPVTNLLSDILDSLQNDNVVTGILHIISHRAWKDSQAYNNCINMASKMLENPNPDFQEFAIKCFENWGDLQNLELLRKAFVHPSMEGYRHEIIRDLE